MTHACVFVANGERKPMILPHYSYRLGRPDPGSPDTDLAAAVDPLLVLPSMPVIRSCYGKLDNSSLASRRSAVPKPSVKVS
jgi:hypothetical protein